MLKGTKDDYTHVTFIYKNGNKMTVNKETHLSAYPNEEQSPKVKKVEYMKR